MFQKSVGHMLPQIDSNQIQVIWLKLLIGFKVKVESKTFILQDYIVDLFKKSLQLVVLKSFIFLPEPWLMLLTWGHTYIPKCFSLAT